MKYTTWLALQHYKPRSLATLESLERHLQGFLREKNLEHSTGLQPYSTWIKAQGYSSKYEQQLYWGLRQYALYLEQVEGRFIPLDLPQSTGAFGVRYALSQPELSRIEQWLESSTQDYWLRQSLWSLFYGSGLRRSEALALKMTDVQIRLSVLRVQTAKRGDQRYLPLSSVQLQALTHYIRLERPTPKPGYEQQLLLGRRGGKAASLLGKELSRWQQGTGLGPKLSWHALRHRINKVLFFFGE